MVNTCDCGKGEDCCSDGQDSFCTCKDLCKDTKSTFRFTCKECGIYVSTAPRCDKCEIISISIN